MSYAMPEEVNRRIACLLCEEKVEEADYEFNIFEVAGIATREVHICSVVAELLSPNGFHGYNRIYLDLFFDVILSGWEKPDKWVNVHKEWSTDKGKDSRFIDIVIEDSTRFIPIEVKINADEGDNQCAAYLDYARNHPRNRSKDKVPLIYLTPDKRPATGLSAKEDAEPISWNDIERWIYECLVATTRDKQSVRYVLHHALAAVRGIILSFEINRWNDTATKNNRWKDESPVADRLNAIDGIISKLIQNDKRMHYSIDTADESITYDVNKSSNLFFRVQSHDYKPCVIAGLITGRKVHSMWKFGGYEGPDYLRGYGATDWWLNKEVIVPYDRFYRLYNDKYLHKCANEIVSFFNRMCEFYG